MFDRHHADSNVRQVRGRKERFDHFMLVKKYSTRNYGLASYILCRVQVIVGSC